MWAPHRLAGLRGTPPRGLDEVKEGRGDPRVLCGSDRRRAAAAHASSPVRVGRIAGWRSSSRPPAWPGLAGLHRDRIEAVIPALITVGLTLCRLLCTAGSSCRGRAINPSPQTPRRAPITTTPSIFRPRKTIPKAMFIKTEVEKMIATSPLVRFSIAAYRRAKLPPNTSAPNRANRRCIAMPNLSGCLSTNANPVNSSAATLNR